MASFFKLFFPKATSYLSCLLTGLLLGIIAFNDQFSSSLLHSLSSYCGALLLNPLGLTLYSLVTLYSLLGLIYHSNPLFSPLTRLPNQGLMLLIGVLGCLGGWLNMHHYTYRQFSNEPQWSLTRGYYAPTHLTDLCVVGIDETDSAYQLQLQSIHTRFFTRHKRRLIAYYPKSKAADFTVMSLFGQQVELSGLIHPYRNLNHLNQIDFDKYDYYKGIAGRLTIHSLALKGKSCVQPVWVYLKQLQVIIQNRIASYNQGQIFAFLLAITTGQRHFLDDSTNLDLKIAGVYHLLSISGVHMQLFGFYAFNAVLYGLLFVPKLRYRYRLESFALVGSMLLSLLYLLISGFSPPAVRALIMFFITQLGQWLSKNPQSLRNLFIAALLMLIYNPAYLFDIGFQLSFMSMVGLHYSQQYLSGIKPRSFTLPYCPHWLTQIFKNCGWFITHNLVTSAIVMLCSGLIGLFYFELISLSSFIVNIIMTPLINYILMPFLIIGTLFPFFTHLSTWSFYLSGLGADWILQLASLNTRWVFNYAQSSLITLNIQWVYVYHLPLIVSLIGLYYRSFTCLFIGLISGVYITFTHPLFKLNDYLYLTNNNNILIVHNAQSSLYYFKNHKPNSNLLNEFDSNYNPSLYTHFKHQLRPNTLQCKAKSPCWYTTSNTELFLLPSTFPDIASLVCSPTTIILFQGRSKLPCQQGIVINQWLLNQSGVILINLVTLATYHRYLTRTPWRVP